VIFRVPTLLPTKKSRTFPGLSRTPMRNFPGPFRTPQMLKYKEKKKPEAQRAKRPEGPTKRLGILGRGSESLPTSYGVWGSTVSSPVGSRAQPRKIWCNLRC